MYHSGIAAIPVKPVTRRMTFTRGQAPRNEKKYLQRKGRSPINRPGYPSAGMPVSTEPIRETVGTWTRIPMSMEPGGRLGHYLRTDMELDPGRQLGAEAPAGYGLAPLSILQSTPSVPSVVTAPVKSDIWNPITSLLNIWDARPQVLKNMRFTVDPNTAMRTLQNVVKPGQVAGAVDQLRAWGISPTYQGLPVTGSTAGFGYQLAGFDFQKWLPWIIGGGALLIVLPMLTRK